MLFAVVENDFETDEDIACVTLARPLIDRKDLLIIVDQALSYGISDVFFPIAKKISKAYPCLMTVQNPESL